MKFKEVECEINFFIYITGCVGIWDWGRAPMRSSVSVILSSPPPDVSMSYPDYDTHPLHHHTLLVLVKQVGESII